MVYYSYKFKPLGKITNIPSSQSFFGTFCYEFQRKYGTMELEKFLDDNYNNPSFAFSSFFIKDFLPLPLNIIMHRKTNLNQNENIKMKNIKKISYLSKSLFKQYLIDKDKFSKEYCNNILSTNYVIVNGKYLVSKEEAKNYQNHFLVDDMLIRNYIPKDDEKKELFYNYVNYCADDLIFEVYASFDNEQLATKANEVIKDMKYVSIGSGKSIGYNMFNFIKLEKETFINNNSEKVLLSLAIGNSSIDYEKSNYKVELLNNRYNGICSTKYQQSVLTFKEGSAINTNQNFISKLLKNEVDNEIKYSDYVGLLV